MDLYINVKTLETTDVFYHKEKNKEVLSELFLSNNVPEEIHFINNVPELGFCQELIMEHRQEKLTIPIKMLIHDLQTELSSINIFFDLGKNDVEKKIDVFTKVWQEIFYKTLNRMSYILPESEDGIKYAALFGEYGIDTQKCVFGECRSTPSFPIQLPKKVMLKYYPNPTAYNDYLKGFQQYFDLKRLDKDDMIKYVIPLYYMDMVYWSESILQNKSKIDYYSQVWIQTLFGALD